MRPILLAPRSVNQIAPSPPAAIPSGRLLGVGMANSAMDPLTLPRPIWLAASSVNQRRWSGPEAIPYGKLEAVGTGYSTTSPQGSDAARLLRSEERRGGKGWR